MNKIWSLHRVQATRDEASGIFSKPDSQILYERIGERKKEREREGGREREKERETIGSFIQD